MPLLLVRLFIICGGGAQCFDVTKTKGHVEMKGLSLLLAATCSLFLNTGCVKEGASPVIQGAEYPDGAASHFLAALRNPGKKDPTHVVSGSEAEMAAIEQYIEFCREAIRFREAFIAEYGEDAWARFQDPEQAQAGGDTSLVFAEELKLKAVDSADVKPGSHVYTSESQEISLEISELNGRYFVDASSLIPDGVPASEFEKMMGKMRAAVEEHRHFIGQPNVSGEELDVRLGKAMLAAMLGK